MNQRNNWMKIAAHINKEEVLNVQCPVCLKMKLKYKYIGNITTRIGYLLLWCDSCKKGIHVSRVKVPENEEIIPIEDLELVKKITPDIELIN